MMPAAPFWSILFFIMLFMLGIDSQFAMVETVITAVVDEFPTFNSKKRKIAVCATFCIAMFLLGLPQCSPVSTTLTSCRPVFASFKRKLESELLASTYAA